jgi:hypothetical protein
VNGFGCVRTLTVAVAFAVALARGAAAEIPADRFCVVPVKDGPPTEADIGDTWRITSDRFLIPGLPGPVFTPVNRRDQWTIDGGRRLVRYDGPFPRSYLDRGAWVTEPWSSRIIAPTKFGGIATLTRGSGRFVEIVAAGKKAGEGYRIATVLVRRKITLTISANGLPWVVGESGVTPWLTADELAVHGIKGIASVHDSPLLQAIVIVDTEKRLHVLTDDGAWQQIGAIGEKEYGRLVDFDGAGAAVFLANNSLTAIRKTGAGASARFSAETLMSSRDLSTRSTVFISKLHGHLLKFERGGIFSLTRRWRRLGPNGFEDLPGGDTDTSWNNMSASAHVHDLPTLGRTVIQGRNALFLYDGKSVVPVPDSGSERIGKYPFFFDLPSIGRVMVTSEIGIFELTRDGTIVPRSLPFPVKGIARPQFADWPDAGIAIVVAVNGVFALDGELNATPMPGGDRIGYFIYDTLLGANPATGEFVLSGRRGIFLAVDTRKSGDEPCRQQREVEARIGDSNLCLRSLPGMEGTAIGRDFRATVEAPGGDGLLIESPSGLLRWRVDGTITPILPSSAQSARTLVSLPWSDEVMAIGVRDTVIRRDLSTTEIVRRQHGDVLGVFPSIRSVLIVAVSSPPGQLQLIRQDDNGYRVVETKIKRNDIAVLADAPWFGAPIVGNWYGLFSLDRAGTLSKFDIEGFARNKYANHSFSGPGRVFRVSDFFAIDRFKTIFAWQKGWFRITSDRRWLPVQGLPSNAIVYGTFDPGRGDVLFGTGHGIFAVNEAGQARAVAGPGAPRRIVRSFAYEAGGRRILAGGDEGLFALRPGSFEVENLTEGVTDAIGAVRRVLDTGFAGINLFEAADGTFEVKDGKIAVVGTLKASTGASGVYVFPRLRALMVKNAGKSGVTFFELARRDAKGGCTEHLTGGR